MCINCKPIAKRGNITVYSPASAATLDLNQLMRGCGGLYSDDDFTGDGSNYAQTKEDQSK